jgi:hypothetical protein
MSRRFQFRLRTLMIGVTLLGVLCGYVRWQKTIVVDRMAMMERVSHADAYNSADGSQAPIDQNKSIPWVRRLLGDEAIVDIYLPVGCHLTAREINAVLPEALIHEYPVDPKIPGRKIIPKAN